jgi:hypothetical protein
MGLVSFGIALCYLAYCWSTDCQEEWDQAVFGLVSFGVAFSYLA